MEWSHLIQQSLRAHVVFEKEKDYVAMDSKIIIVDEFTGRLMHGRQWSDGLHQAVEAKEGVTVKEETQTLATITLQNFFKLYDQIAGMTGTAATEADEFMKIYKLEVVVIPTNQPCIRDDQEDVIYKTKQEKFDAIVEEINRISAEGRPVLVGTISIEKSEALSAALTKARARARGAQRQAARPRSLDRGQGRPAAPGPRRQHPRQCHHRDQHGRPRHRHQARSGRGRDRRPAHPRHRAARSPPHRQPVARPFRPPGRCRVQPVLPVLRRRPDARLRAEWTVKALSWIGWEEGQPIYHKRISKGIAKAQKKVEERNFEIRKSLLDYDEVMDYQRKIFYSRRRDLLAGKSAKPMILEMIEAAITKQTKEMLDRDYPLRSMIEWARANFDVDLKLSQVVDATAQEIEQLIKDRAKDSVRNDISISLGEYLEDYDDPSTWDTAGLSKWAMNSST